MKCFPNNYTYVPNQLFLNKGGKIHDDSTSQNVSIKTYAALLINIILLVMCVTAAAVMKCISL
jgi:hypothetical protein